jgi:hypothetical protein
VTCGVDACEVEAEELMNNFLLGDSAMFVGLSFGFSLGN